MDTKTVLWNKPPLPTLDKHTSMYSMLGMKHHISCRFTDGPKQEETEDGEYYRKKDVYNL